MKYLLVVFVLFSTSAGAQIVDSFYRDNTMWYTESRRGLPVRVFYPRSSLQYCAYCNLWRTPEYVKLVKAQYQQMAAMPNVMLWTANGLVADSLYVRKTVKKSK